MSVDIIKLVQNCKIGTKEQKENPKEKILLQEYPERPWQIFASDIYHLKDKEYLLMADSYSGYFDFVQLSSLTSRSITRAFRCWFATFGIPDILRTDGGKQYVSEEFKEFARRWRFEHRVSSPQFPRPNGLAERYVQEARSILDKCIEEGSDIQLALLHHRNTPRDTLGSPMQRLMGRRTKTFIPINTKLLLPETVKNVSEKLKNIKLKEKKCADRAKANLPEF